MHAEIFIHVEYLDCAIVRKDTVPTRGNVSYDIEMIEDF